MKFFLERIVWKFVTLLIHRYIFHNYVFITAHEYIKQWLLLFLLPSFRILSYTQQRYRPIPNEREIFKQKRRTVGMKKTEPKIRPWILFHYRPFRYVITVVLIRNTGNHCDVRNNVPTNQEDIKKWSLSTCVSLLTKI